jgi:hypothetical protein
MSEELTTTENTQPEVDPLALVAQETGIDIKLLNKWKQEFVDIYATKFPLSGKIFIYRGVSREEWKSIREGLQGGNLDEKLVSVCTLFPKITPELLRTNEIKAWTLDTLVNQIRMVSDFYPDQVAFELVTKL